MAKSKKTKSELKKDRVADANKARQTMIDNAIAEHEAKKKLEKANRKKSAKRAAAAKKARQTMIDNAIAEYEAKKNHEKDKAAQTVYHPAKITNDKYTQDLKLSYYSRAGARAQGATALSFALCSLVFTIAYFVL